MELLAQWSWRIILILVLAMGTYLNFTVTTNKGKVGGAKTVLKVIIFELIIIYIVYSLSEFGVKSSFGIINFWLNVVSPLGNAILDYITGR